MARKTAGRLIEAGDLIGAIELLESRQGSDAFLLGQLYLFVGRIEDATLLAGRLRAGKNADKRGRVAWLLGRIAAAERRWAVAAEQFALSIGWLASPVSRCHALLDTSELALLCRDPQRARVAFDRAQAEQANDDALCAGRGALVEGWLALDAERQGDAELASARAVALAGDAGASLRAWELGWQSRQLRAGWQLAAEEPGLALAELERAQQRIDGLADRLPPPDRAGFLARDSVHRLIVDQQVLHAALLAQQGPRARTRRAELVREHNALLHFETVARAMAAENQPERLLELVLDTCIEVSGAVRGFLILDDAGEMTFQLARNLDQQQIESAKFEISHTIAWQVIRTGQPVLANNATADPRFSTAPSVVGLALNSILCVPLLQGGATVGAIYLDHPEREAAFGKFELQICETIAAQASLAIANTRLLSNLTAHSALLESRQAEIEALNLELSKFNGRLQQKVGRQQAEIQQVREALASRQKQLEQQYRLEGIVGRSPAMQKVFSRLDKAAQTEFTVLVTGESGTGKELVARALHFTGPRKQQPFVSENCGAIPQSLMESVLFGHEKGAFTGAAQEQSGLFELADGGTLFLDEVGELSLEAQTRMLRVLQESEVRPVGSRSLRKVDVRVIAATNRDLRQMIRSGAFREDLFYRLDVIRIDLPPLRERGEDIPLLIASFLADLQSGLEVCTEVHDLLAVYSWPGNVRELHNEVQRWITFSREKVAVSDLSPRIALGARVTADGWAAGDPLAISGMTLKALEAEAIRRALQATKGNKAAAARRLGLPRRTLYDKLKQHGLCR